MSLFERIKRIVSPVDSYADWLGDEPECSHAGLTGEPCEWHVHGHDRCTCDSDDHTHDSGCPEAMDLRERLTAALAEVDGDVWAEVPPDRRQRLIEAYRPQTDAVLAVVAALDGDDS